MATTNTAATRKSCTITSLRSHACGRTRRGAARRRNRAVIPVFIGLAVLDAPHVEPGRRVSGSGFSWIRKLADDTDGHEVPLSDDRDHLRPPCIARRNRRRRPAAEELHHWIETGRDVRIVL